MGEIGEDGAKPLRQPKKDGSQKPIRQAESEIPVFALLAILANMDPRTMSELIAKKKKAAAYLLTPPSKAPDFFFAISSLAVLGSMLAKMANSAKTGITFSACLMGFWLPSFFLAALVALPHPLLCLPHLGLAARKTHKRTAMETSCVANEP